MRCDNCDTKTKHLVHVLIDSYEEEGSLHSFTRKAWWCSQCFNGPNGDMEAARITIEALKKQIMSLERL